MESLIVFEEGKIKKERLHNQMSSMILKNSTKLIINNGKIPIRFAVYVGEGEFKGYKTNDFWNLVGEGNLNFEVHKERHALQLGAPIKNLIEIITEFSDYFGGTNLYVVAEQVDENGEFVEELFGYHIAKDEEGKFAAY